MGDFVMTEIIPDFNWHFGSNLGINEISTASFHPYAMHSVFANGKPEHISETFLAESTHMVDDGRNGIQFAFGLLDERISYEWNSAVHIGGDQQCDNSFSQEAHLTRHIDSIDKNFHPAEINVLQVSYFRQITESTSQNEAPASMDFEEKPSYEISEYPSIDGFSCYYCGAYFAEREHFTAHVGTHGHLLPQLYGNMSSILNTYNFVASSDGVNLNGAQTQGMMFPYEESCMSFAQYGVIGDEQTQPKIPQEGGQGDFAVEVIPSAEISGPSSNDLFCCYYCDKSFADKASFTSHVDTCGHIFCMKLC